MLNFPLLGLGYMLNVSAEKEVIPTAFVTSTSSVSEDTPIPHPFCPATYIFTSPVNSSDHLTLALLLSSVITPALLGEIFHVYPVARAKI